MRGGMGLTPSALTVALLHHEKTLGFQRYRTAQGIPCLCRRAGVGTDVTSHAHAHEKGFDLLLRILALGGLGGSSFGLLGQQLSFLGPRLQVPFAPASDTSHQLTTFLSFSSFLFY